MSTSAGSGRLDFGTVHMSPLDKQNRPTVWYEFGQSDGPLLIHPEGDERFGSDQIPRRGVAGCTDNGQLRGVALDGSLCWLRNLAASVGEGIPAEPPHPGERRLLASEVHQPTAPFDFLIRIKEPDDQRSC